MTSLSRLFRNTVFRLSLVAAALFAISSFIILAYVYSATTGAELKRIDQEIQSEIDELVSVKTTYGMDELNQEVVYRSLEFGGGLYLLQKGRDKTGNLNAFPMNAEDNDKDFAFQYERFVKEGEPTQIRHARGRYIELSRSDRLLVGRDIELITNSSDRVMRAIWVSAGIALGLGLLSGIFVSSRFARRIDAFNLVAQDVRAGNLSSRVPRDESGDELDNLAQYLNAMLDHLEQLVEAMRHAGDAIAHDLRSPLTRLRTRLETAAGSAKDEDSMVELTASAEDAGEILRTFESVLRIARLEAGERRQSLVALDPLPILEDLIELYEPVCEDAQQTFNVDLQKGLTIRADRGLISQAVANLLDNAIKYAPTGGEISLTLRRSRQGRVLITVTDRGPGIAEKDRNRVLRRFVRLDSSRNAPGSGLGLSFVKAVADMHEATFTLTDRDDPKESGLKAELSLQAVKRSDPRKSSGSKGTAAS